MPWSAPSSADVTMRQIRGDGQRDGLVAVVGHAILGAMQPCHAFDDDLAVHALLDDGAHLLQELDEIEDLRLDGGVLITVTPRASVAAISTVSVAITLGNGSSIVVPCSPSVWK